MRLRWVLLPLLAGAAYFALFGGEYSFWDVRRIEKQRAEDVKALQQARTDVVRLRARADSLEHDTATLERVAREKYGLVKPGERLYRFTDTPHADSAAAAAAPPPDR